MSTQQRGRLQEKIALVTGGAGGMGYTTAELFAQEGATVIVGDVQEPDPFDAEEVEFVDLDVSNEDSWADVISFIDGEYGRLDVLFNSAGIISYDSITDADMETWERNIGVNKTGVFLGMKRAIPLMRETNGGSIVNTSSTWGNVGAEGTAVYQPTKGAVQNMSKMLRSRTQRTVFASTRSTRGSSIRRSSKHRTTKPTKPSSKPRRWDGSLNPKRSPLGCCLLRATRPIS